MNLIAKEIPALQDSPEDVYVVHFSHGPTSNAHHFYPRIFCIYVQNINASDSRKFSIENLVKKQNIPIEEIADWYDELEPILLDDFDAFLRSKINCVFIYWVEDNGELILDVIKSRFDELNKTENKSFCSIPTPNRKSVHFLISKIDNTAPKDLKQFIKTYNNQNTAGFLSIAEEQGFFDKKDFGKVGASVVSKVSFFVRLIQEYSNKDSAPINIKTPSAESIDIRALRPRQLFSKLTSGSWLIIIGLITGAFGGGWGLKGYLDEEDIKDVNKDKTKVELELKDKSESFIKQNQIMGDSVDILKKENSSLSLELKEKSDSLKLKNKKTN